MRSYLKLRLDPIIGNGFSAKKCCLIQFYGLFLIVSKFIDKEIIMGAITASWKIENNLNRSISITISKILVDTGSELSWISSKHLEKIGIQREKKDLTFMMANGKKITRGVGFAIMRIEDYFTIVEVVFAEEVICCC